jgi:hypothetical protein
LLVIGREIVAPCAQGAGTRWRPVIAVSVLIAFFGGPGATV